MTLKIGRWYQIHGGKKVQLSHIAKTGVNSDIENSNDVCVFFLDGIYRSLQSQNFEAITKPCNPFVNWQNFWRESTLYFQRKALYEKIPEIKQAYVKRENYCRNRFKNVKRIKWGNKQ